MIKKLFIHYSLNTIRQYYPQYDKVKIEQLKYGIEGIYLTISKLFIIFLIAIYLGIFKEVLILTFLFNIIRLPAFGAHASKSWICLIISSAFLLGIPLYLKYFALSIIYKLLICIACIICFILYAPADTKKRPIINKQLRRRLKTIAVITAILFTIGTLLINNYLIATSLIAALIVETIMILPITYKIFNQEYNNYKRYQ